MKKDLKKLMKSLKEQGWTLQRRTKGWMVYPPQSGLSAVMIHETLSDSRSWKNQMALLRRSGFIE